MHPNKPMLTVAEAARELGLTQSAIRAWIARRSIRFVRVGKRSVRIPAEAVDSIIRDGMNSPRLE